MLGQSLGGGAYMATVLAETNVLSLLRHSLGGCAYMAAALAVQGYLAHKNSPFPRDHRRTLGIFLLSGPRETLFLMSEVPL